VERVDCGDRALSAATSVRTDHDTGPHIVGGSPSPPTGTVNVTVVEEPVGPEHVSQRKS
jgi:hypothetical protein